MNEISPIRVLIADDQRMVRAGLRALLNADPRVEVVGEADDGQIALDMVRQCHPDVVLMDIRMPVLDGLEATRRLRCAEPAVQVVILTTFDTDEYVLEAVRAGASGFLLKDGDADDLVRAIEAAVRGDALIAPGALRKLLDAVPVNNRSPVHAQLIAGLTPREREVLELVARGLSNREISARLQVSDATTKTHISSLLAKLQARDRAQLVIAAYEGGVV